MKKKDSRNLLKVIPLLIIGLLLATGIAYGLWSETLLIDGVVHTGEVYGEWIFCGCFDTGLDLNPPPGVQPKDVGKTICQIDQQDPRIVHITVENGYPSYYNLCDLKYKNSGSVPVIIRGIKVVAKNFDLASGNGNGDGEIWVEAIDGVGSQLEPRGKKSLNLEFHVEQPAKENYTYKFDVYVCLAQWNEYATMDQCLAAAPKY